LENYDPQLAEPPIIAHSMSCLDKDVLKGEGLQEAVVVHARSSISSEEHDPVKINSTVDTVDDRFHDALEALANSSVTGMLVCLYHISPR
jgi:hypothetical protein